MRGSWIQHWPSLDRRTHLGIKIGELGVNVWEGAREWGYSVDLASMAQSSAWP